MRDAITIALMLIGAVFILVAGVGIVRLPDFYMRISATTKAATFGVGSLLLAAALHFDDLAIASRAISVVVFVLCTAPVAAHMIGRAAYRAGVPLWEGTVCDELRDQGAGEPRPPDEEASPARPPGEPPPP
jgi:multicomponent Na+:H+ antiporter subunit G